MDLTIVTVCLNCRNDIKKTIDSLAKQTFSDYEYLVIDGKSTDGTLEEVNNSKALFKTIRVVSEKDKGIYDAMNKGAQLAQGKYILFLNAGDMLYDKTVLQNIIDSSTDNADVYYGAVIRGDTIETYPERITLPWLIYREKMICHQAIIAKRELLVSYPIDCNFRICGDREWLIRIIKSGKSIKSIQPLIIAVYDLNGVSSNKELYSRDSIKIAEKYAGLFGVLVVKIKRLLGLIVKGRLF